MTAQDKLFYQFPIIKTERLILNPLNEADLDELYHLYNADDTQQYQSNHYYSKDSLRKYIKDQSNSFQAKEKIMWAIRDNQTKEFIGVRIFYCDNPSSGEIQGDTKKAKRRKGLTKEAYLGIIKYLKACNFEGIYSRIQSENLSAIKLSESVGLIKYSEEKDPTGLKSYTYMLRF
jgi:ribosomal-protein-alanine N-acetyltransferase